MTDASNSAGTSAHTAHHESSDDAARAALLTPRHGLERGAQHGSADAHVARLPSLLHANGHPTRSAADQHEASQDHQRQIKLLATVAHELRNPLAALAMTAGLLGSCRADEQQHARLQERILRQVAHLARIVEDLLDGSRVRTGKFHLVCERIDLVAIFDQAVEACRPAMDAKQQHLKLQLPHGPLPVHGDAVRLNQIFRNLLDNASKYTPVGGSIALQTVPVNEDFVITVSDNGIGIAAEALPAVFNLFVQDPRAVAVHAGGLGIGLAVVRELVEAHGGRVVASSAGHDLGSEFVVTLPMARG